MLKEKYVRLYMQRIVKLYNELSEAYWGNYVTLHAEMAVSKRPVPFSMRSRGSLVPVEEGQDWGERGDSAWFHIFGEIPQEWRNRTLALRLNLGGEAQIFSDSGMPLSSFTNTSIYSPEYQKEIGFLEAETIHNGILDLWVEAGANGLQGNVEIPGFEIHASEKIGRVKHLKLAVFYPEVWKLRLDFEVLLGMLNLVEPKDCGGISEKSYRFTQILHVLNQAADAYGDSPENAERAREILASELRRPAADSAMTIYAVGHGHIDTGWLWPVRETIRKCARTFGHQLQLMKRYPEYIFGASQAQHYEFMKEYYPALFEEIKRRVAEGRWEIQGGMWVEPDCNLPAGESLVRQFLFGKNFFRKEFGIEVKNLWLPDAFGFSAALPQIIRKAGCDIFMSQKLSWNQVNRFPYHAFIWHGLDDSRVLSFFLPEDTYNSMLLPNELNYGCDNLTENYLLDKSLTLFGMGDGGGGPKEEHVERGIRCANLDGVPKVKFSTAERFFDYLRQKQDRLPHWHHELYLEKHRGTLTTQAENKKCNRRAEQKMAEAEFVASLCPVSEWPGELFSGLWKKVLINQFHDILPGSSIHEVYEVSRRDYGNIFSALSDFYENFSKKFCKMDGCCVTLINTLSYGYKRLVRVPESWRGYAVYHNHRRLQIADGFVDLPLDRQEIAVLERGEEQSAEEIIQKDGMQLENAFVICRFSADGRLVSVFDKELQREMLAAPGNDFTLYVDSPNSFDAWDIDPFYVDNQDDKARLVKHSPVFHSEIRESMVLDYEIGRSHIQQEVVLEKHSKRLEFRTAVDWREKSRMLRVKFPTGMICDECSCDTQYGYIRRSTHRDTDQEAAKYEFAVHRYVDLSESRCGVALLNDCKYGCRIEEGTIDLNLLRSPSWPDPEADRGRHEFTYALLPHTGDLNHSEVMAEAAQLNRSCLVLSGKYNGPGFLCRLLEASANVTWEVLKKAELSEDRILRIVDWSGEGGDAVFFFADNIQVRETDLMEWHDEEELPVENHQLKLHLRPFEIKTLKLKKIN